MFKVDIHVWRIVCTRPRAAHCNVVVALSIWGLGANVTGHSLGLDHLFVDGVAAQIECVGSLLSHLGHIHVPLESVGWAANGLDQLNQVFNHKRLPNRLRSLD